MGKLLPTITGLILFGLPAAALADVPQYFAQAQQQNRSQLDSDYQNRLRSARSSEERARIQAEYDRQMQQGALPSHDHSDSRVQTAPGTAGSGTLPYTQDRGPAAGESPTGGGQSRLVRVNDCDVLLT